MHWTYQHCQGHFVKFAVVWGELESKAYFQRQSVTKCLRLTLFSKTFASIDKILNLTERLFTRVSFYEV